MLYWTNTFSHANKFEDLILNSPPFIFVKTQLKNIYRIIINNISQKILFFCHPASCTMGTGPLSQGTAHWVWHWPPAPSSAEVKERVAIPLNLLSAFMAHSWVNFNFFYLLWNCQHIQISFKIWQHLWTLQVKTCPYFCMHLKFCM